MTTFDHFRVGDLPGVRSRARRRLGLHADCVPHQVSSVGENVANLREIVRLIRKHVPRAEIVFTLSPVIASDEH